MDNVMHIIKVAVPILFALIVLILLWTLFKAARKKIKDTQLTMAAMVAVVSTSFIFFFSLLFFFFFISMTTGVVAWSAR